MRNSFPVLTFVSALLRVVGWIIAIVGLLYFVFYQGFISPSRYNHSDYGGFNSRQESFNYNAIGIGISATISGFIAIIIGECVGVLFAIEENTHQAAAKLTALLIAARSPAPVATARAQTPPGKETIPKANTQGDPEDQ